jgi:hypothetical protein
MSLEARVDSEIFMLDLSPESDSTSLDIIEDRSQRVALTDIR